MTVVNQAVMNVAELVLVDVEPLGKCQEVIQLGHMVDLPLAFCERSVLISRVDHHFTTPLTINESPPFLVSLTASAVSSFLGLSHSD